MPKIKLTTAERIEVFRPNVMLGRLDRQEAAFVNTAMQYARVQAENLCIHYQNGIKPDKLALLPEAVREIADALAASMIDTYNLGQISFQNERLQAEQIHQLKLDGVYTPNVVPFAAMREGDLNPLNQAFYPEAGVDWYKNYTLRLAGVHSVDALDYTKKAIIQGVEDGLDQAQVISLLRKQYTEFSQWRLENIARTETAKIYEQARYQQMVDDEEIVGYEFVAVSDSRTTEICRHRDGKRIRKDDVEGWLPPLHYGCRSVLMPIFAWEEGTQYSIPSVFPPALKGFGSTEMTIPESARNKIYIGGIPELRKEVKVVEPVKEKVVIPDWKTKEEAAEWMNKQFGIAQFNFSGGGRTWGAEIKKESDQIAHMRRISEEWLRLQEIYPNIPKKTLHTLWVTDPARARANAFTNTPMMSVQYKPYDKATIERQMQWEKINGRRWGVPREDKTPVQDAFRHEYAHVMTRRNPNIMSEFYKIQQAEGLDNKWLQYNISEYAKSNIQEAMAETITLITSTEYKYGSLPKALEEWVDNIVFGGRAK